MLITLGRAAEILNASRDRTAVLLHANNVKLICCAGDRPKYPLEDVQRLAQKYQPMRFWDRVAKETAST
jgi:predicted HTH domain antitoxin